MLSRFMPREEKFFEQFEEMSKLMVEAAKALEAMLADMSHAESHAAKVKDLEHKCDEITHRTMEMLHRTFITPLDREDIHGLISSLDDVVDFIDAVAGRVFLYDLKESTPEMRAMAETSRMACEVIARTVVKLDKIKDPKELLNACIEINRLENDADRTLRSAMAKLFREEKNAIEVIKKKELFQLLESITDKCEDVANVIESIVIEYS